MINNNNTSTNQTAKLVSAAAAAAVAAGEHSSSSSRGSSTSTSNSSLPSSSSSSATSSSSAVIVNSNNTSSRPQSHLITNHNHLAILPQPTRRPQTLYNPVLTSSNCNIYSFSILIFIYLFSLKKITSCSNTRVFCLFVFVSLLFSRFSSSVQTSNSGYEHEYNKSSNFR